MAVQLAPPPPPPPHCACTSAQCDRAAFNLPLLPQSVRSSGRGAYLAIEAGLASFEKPRGSKKPSGLHAPTMSSLAWMPWQAGCMTGARSMPLLTRARGLPRGGEGETEREEAVG
eukprot:scaffold93311_cov31-Tisochrysis_lutea.AAC.6